MKDSSDENKGLKMKTKDKLFFRSLLSAKIFTPFLYKLLRIPVFTKYKEYSAHDYWTRKHLLEYQEEKLVDILVYAAKHIPFYKKKLEEKKKTYKDIKDAKDIQYFPILTKEDINKYETQLCNQAIKKRDYSTLYSGGSTGQPTKILRDLESAAVVQAITWRSNKWAGWEIGDPWGWIWGRLSTTKASYSSRMIAFYKKYLCLEDFINVHGLNEQKLNECIQNINLGKPKLLIGYTNAFYQMSLLAKEKNITLPEVEIIISTSEMLFKEQRSMIEKHMRASIFDRYASNEIGVIGTQCEVCDGFHIMSDAIYMESVSDDANSVKSGESGILLLTSLTNRKMPLIRYQIGDTGMMTDEVCSCGRPYPILKKFTGRITDLIKLANGNTVFPEDFGEIIYPLTESISNFQIIQHQINQIEMLIVFKPGKETEEIKKLIIDKLVIATEGQAKIGLRTVKDIPILPSGKHRTCISKL